MVWCCVVIVHLDDVMIVRQSIEFSLMCLLWMRLIHSLWSCNAVSVRCLYRREHTRYLICLCAMDPFEFRFRGYRVMPLLDPICH